LKPQAYWISDDFTDPSFDPFRWHVASHGTGVEVAERNERLEFSIAPDVAFDDVYGVDQHYGSQCSLTGDFDARVDFALLTWPAENGVFVQLGVWFPPPSEGYWVASRQSAPYTGGTDAYSSNFGSNVSVRTTDLAGGLRVRRVNGVLTTYYRHGSTWIQLSSARNSRPSVPILELWTTSTLFGHQAAQVAFDNFQATARAVQCPGVPLPPRKSQG
jgi:hypothetical protein